MVISPSAGPSDQRARNDTVGNKRGDAGLRACGVTRPSPARINHRPGPLATLHGASQPTYIKGSPRRRVRRSKARLPIARHVVQEYQPGKGCDRQAH